MTRLPRFNSAALVLVCLVLAAACHASRLSLALRHGLRGEYFAGEEAAGEPTVTMTDQTVTTASVASAWGGSPPAVFSARWFGYLTVLRGGTYTFATTSDDGSSLSIDGRVVVDNRGVHGPATATGRIDLQRGTYPVLIEYAQRGGGFELEWTYAFGNDALTRVPAWRLHPVRADTSVVLVARGLELSEMGLLLVALLLLPLAAQRAPLIQRFPRAAALLFFTAMAVIHTWPLATDPAHLSRSDNGDTMLNEWIIAWVSHQALQSPAHLFAANIFHPEPDTLAYSESMIVQSAMAAPLFWLGASPTLAYSLVLLAGFTLTAWTMALVMARWTGSWTAALIAGLVFGFNAHTLTRIPHLQAQHGEFLPLAAYALDQAVTAPSVRAALRLALWFVLQSLTSVYMMAFTTIAMIAASVARPDGLAPARRRRVVAVLSAAALVTSVGLLPFLLPYWRVNQQQGLTRSLADAALYAASWNDYLSTPSRLHYPWWSQRFFVGTALFPGALGLLLALIAVVSGSAFIDRRARMCLTIGAAGVALSFGPAVPGYAWLYAAMPLLRAVRATARFGYLGIFAVAALAGFGTLVVERMLRPQHWRTAGALLVAIATVEPIAAPLGFSRVTDVPAIYSHLPADAGAVVELPFYNGRSAFAHAPYMRNSTAHWRPLVNGYSGFQPPSFHRHVQELAGFPDPTSIAALRRLGVTHVFLHGSILAADQVTAYPELEFIEQDAVVVLYRLH